MKTFTTTSAERRATRREMARKVREAVRAKKQTKIKAKREGVANMKLSPYHMRKAAKAARDAAAKAVVA